MLFVFNASAFGPFLNARFSFLSYAHRDIKPFIPNLIRSIETPKEVPEIVHLLSATTFVQTVNFAALSVMSPLLVRGLGERATATKRQCARIIENMTKLVDEPQDVAPFLPKLLPLLEVAKVYSLCLLLDLLLFSTRHSFYLLCTSFLGLVFMLAFCTCCMWPLRRWHCFRALLLINPSLHPL